MTFDQQRGNIGYRIISTALFTLTLIIPILIVPYIRPELLQSNSNIVRASNTITSIVYILCILTLGWNCIFNWRQESSEPLFLFSEEEATNAEQGRQNTAKIDRSKPALTPTVICVLAGFLLAFTLDRYLPQVLPSQAIEDLRLGSSEVGTSLIVVGLLINFTLASDIKAFARWRVQTSNQKQAITSLAVFLSSLGLSWSIFFMSQISQL